MKHVICILLFAGFAFGQTYSLPNDNNGCPSNCRLISWSAGMDASTTLNPGGMPGGGAIPTYTPVTCNGLTGNGTTDDGPAIQTCINAQPGTSANPRAVYIPAGTYLVSSLVRLKNYVVLRGAKSEPNWSSPLPASDAAATTIRLGSGANITTQNFSYDSGDVTPAVHSATYTAPYNFSGTPQKGDTTATISTGSPSVGSWLAIFGNDDPSLINVVGQNGTCYWCGENTGFMVAQQLVQVTAKVGNVLTFSKPWYYPPYTTAVTDPGGQTGVTEAAGAHYRIWTFPTQYAGFENLRFDGSAGDIGDKSILEIQGCLHCWVRNVETYMTGGNSESAHVALEFSYGNEVRDSFLHDQRSGASGSGYGVYFKWINGDHKVENVVFRHNRHAIVYQGGGVGTAVLYNFIDNDYTDDCSYLASARTSHGAHPYMNLWEGNVISHVTADDYWGTSSHFTFFRNWIWGDESQDSYTNHASGGGMCAVAPGPPVIGYDAIDLGYFQTYYSFVGNVLGNAQLSGQTNHARWSSATVRPSPCAYMDCGYTAPTSPVVYSFGGSGAASGETGAALIPSSSTTSLNHGNYDYKTAGVAYWEGGSAHTLPNAIYYSSAQPSFLSGYKWPIMGPDQLPGATLTNVLPAIDRFYGYTPPSGGTSVPHNVSGAGALGSGVIR